MGYSTKGGSSGISGGMEGLVEAFNDTACVFDEAVTLQELFEAEAGRSAERVALCCEGAYLSYGELNGRANVLARALRDGGTGREEIVGIICERGFEMMTGILGILKAGGAYLPLSPYDPQDRIQRIMEDAGVRALVVQDKYRGKVETGARVFVIEAYSERMDGRENLPLVNESGDLAYVIYTSGSTGMPKGVMIEHRSVINRLEWMQRAYPISSDDIVLQKTPYNFDVSVWELFWWFMQGARLCFLAPTQEKNPIALIGTIGREGVSVMHFVPPLLGIFLEYVRETGVSGKLGSLRLVFSSGEALGVKSVLDFGEVLGFEGAPGSESGRKLVNLYGPTEATVDVTHYDCSQGLLQEKVPIGRPISNTRLYIEGAGGQLAGIGEEGELLIGGVGVARGYLNRVELTAEKFVSCPFDKGGRVYRTGDLARWFADGNIEYIGRIDNQVKIRGIRIELDEIKAALCGHGGINDCIIDIRKYSESVIVIVAYYFAAEAIDPKELKSFLGGRLPEYMVPSRYIRLDHLPLNANGKLDRKALPA